jgi:hypothetical protein
MEAVPYWLARIHAEEVIDAALDLERGGARPEWWTRRKELCWDVPADLVEQAAYDFLLRNRETLEEHEADVPNHDAIGDLIYDPEQPAGLPTVLKISDETIRQTNENRQASVSRRHLAYWVARERIAAVDSGAPLDAVRPIPLRRPSLAIRARPMRFVARSARPRAVRRRVRRAARSPDDPSRPRRSPLAAARGAGWSA